MNTRLQVEHPVTELLTGVDLAQGQLRVAAGEGLPREGRAELRGHAIELRINAEDPAHDFRPAPGTVTRFRPPLGPGVRVDTHVVDGYVIPPYYDSLVAKVIVWAEDRPAALRRAVRALTEFKLEGVPTTRELAIDILESDEFASGDYTTAFLGEAGASLAALTRRGGRVSGRRAARRTALELLYQWDLTGQPLASLHEGDVDEFALELAEGVAEQAPELDERISEASDEWRADRLGVVERNVVRMGLYELDRGDVPVEVAVDEAVSLAKRYASEDAGRLVNGILGRVVREARQHERARFRRPPPGAPREGRGGPGRAGALRGPRAGRRRSCRSSPNSPRRCRPRSSARAGRRMNRPDDLRELTEDFLGGLPFAAELGKLEAALRYSLLGGGKRIRPVLCLATGEALGREPRSCCRPRARSSSCTRSASSTTTCRRWTTTTCAAGSRAPTCSSARTSRSWPGTRSWRRPSASRCATRRRTSRASSPTRRSGMIGGQYLDVTTDGELDSDGLRRLHALKTGRLLRASRDERDRRRRPPGRRARAPGAASATSSACSSRSSTTSSTRPARPRSWARLPGKDEAAGKVTYVSLHGLERARELADEARGRVQERLEALPADTSVLAELVATIRDRRA